MNWQQIRRKSGVPHLCLATMLVICTADSMAAESSVSVPENNKVTAISPKLQAGQTQGDRTAPGRTAPASVSAGGSSLTANIELWQVTSHGGSVGSSQTYSLSWTMGQSAVGVGTSATYGLNRGFWQTFSTGCCVGKRGNINLVGIVDVADLSTLVTYLTDASHKLVCYDEANISGSGIVDLTDLSALVNYLTGGGYELPNCP